MGVGGRQEVSGLGLHALAVQCLFIKRLTDSLVVIEEESAVNHDLKFSIPDATAPLGTVVEEVEGLLGESVLDADESIDGVVVASDQLVMFPVPSGSVVANSLLHFQSIGVSVEYSFIVDVRVADSEDDFLALLIFNVDAVDMCFYFHLVIPAPTRVGHCPGIELQLATDVIVVERVYSE